MKNRTAYIWCMTCRRIYAMPTSFISDDGKKYRYGTMARLYGGLFCIKQGAAENCILSAKIFGKLLTMRYLSDTLSTGRGKGEISMRRHGKIVICTVALILTFAASLCTGCGISSDVYTEEQHIQRITERAEARFLGEESEYTGLEVYPVYNEYDELKYALIEFEPQGFLYVAIADREYSWKGMYTLSNTESRYWVPYRVKEGSQDILTDEDGSFLEVMTDCELFRDENGDIIIYYQSHFKVAGIENERRYLLSIMSTAAWSYGEGLIPAVKRGEQYLNLVDGNLMDYEPGMESATYAVGNIGFFYKSFNDL